MGWQLSQRALVHSTEITQPQSKHEVMHQAMLFLILYICYVH